jgi:hypothetical protein
MLLAAATIQLSLYNMPVLISRLAETDIVAGSAELE